MQIDLNSYLITINSIIRGCERFKLAFPKLGYIKKLNVKSKLFLINILFSYIGRYENDKTMNEYALMPDLFNEEKKNIDNNDKNVVAIIVDQKGEINKIYEDLNKKKEIDFQLKSHESRKSECSGEIKDITKENIY
jgi:hypothetical protein